MRKIVVSIVLFLSLVLPVAAQEETPAEPTLEPQPTVVVTVEPPVDEPPPVEEPPAEPVPGTLPPDVAAVLAVVLLGAAGVNRFVEFVKVYIRNLPYTVTTQDNIILLVSVLAGLVVAFMGNMNLLFVVPTIPAILGVTLTGILMAFGADVLHVVVDLLYGWKELAEARSKTY